MALNRRSSSTHSSPSDSPQDVRAPSALKLLLEARAPSEWAALLAAAPWLRQLPNGDGHPVIVFPGLAATDLSTVPLRRFLEDRGYVAYPWRQGFNFGPRDGVLEACAAQVREVAARHRCKLSLIGWSLGGVYAREMARAQPDLVRCVVTLGSPFAGHPRATNAWRVYELVSGRKVDADPALLAQLALPPPVPTTSIYSRSDGVVAWQCSINPDAPKAENIEVHASHLGMGVNPLALYAIADRLAQPPDDWQRFHLDGARRWFYKTTHATAVGSTGGADSTDTARNARAA